MVRRKTGKASSKKLSIKKKPPATGESLSKAEQREQTRRLLLQIARQEFTEHGYAGAATERIVERAGLTRGALYHQFRDKRDLFRAVFIEAQREIVAAIGAAVEQAADGWAALVDGCRAFLAASTGPELQRIVLIDGPAVLGLEEWRRLDYENGYQELKLGVGAVMDAGLLPKLPLDALTTMLSGAMNDGALYCAAAKHPAKALKESQATIVAMLEALRLAAAQAGK